MKPLVFALAALAWVTPTLAQTPTEAARAEGKAFGAGKASTAQGTATTDPDAARIPNFSTAPSQSGYFDDPDRMSREAASNAPAHGGYRTMRDSMDQRATFARTDIEAAIARSSTISDDPLSYTSGMSIGGSQGRCVPLPPAMTSAGRYMATCNVGTVATPRHEVCAIPFDVKVTTNTEYIYWCNDAPLHQVNGVDDCAALVQGGCTRIGTTPGKCLQWFTDAFGQRHCTEPGEAIDILSCPRLVPGATLKDTKATSQIETVKNESACVPFAADPACRVEAERCTDSDPVTRIVNGVPVTQPCWAWEKSYDCSTSTQAQDCSTLEATPGCTFVREDCLVGDPCGTWERVYDCPFPDTPAPSNQFICDGDVYCIDGSCETIQREANDEFKQAVVALNAMAQARREFDPETLTLFKGTRNTCSSKVFGILNCCKGKGFALIPGIQLLVALGCDRDEILLHQRDAQGLCSYVGTYCSDSVLGVCLTKKKVYCCFESKLSRILQEQGRPQLNKPWGKPKTEQCLGFTLDEFAQLDLSKMDFSEVYAEFTEAARLPDEIAAAQDIQQKIEDYYARTAH